MAQQIIISTDDDRFYGSEAAPGNADKAYTEYRRLVNEEIASYYPEAAVEFRWEHGARACAVFGVEDLP